MRDKESLYPKDWFAKAEKDVFRAEILFDRDDFEGAGFHLQQALEKYFKGYLISRGWKLKKTHDLEVLLNFSLEHNKDLEEHRTLCEKVTDYYIDERYPLSIPSGLNKEEVKKEIILAKELIQKLLSQ